MTLIDQARKGFSSALLKRLAREEKIFSEELLALVARGRLVVPYNRNHSPARPAAIGLRMRTKVNVNLGTSRDYPTLRTEIAKLKISLKYGADTIMDLSTGGDIRAIRKRLLSLSPLPLGTVPVYQAAIEAISRRGSIIRMTEDDLFSVIEAQAREGVDFMTVHCGLTLKAVERLKSRVGLPTSSPEAEPSTWPGCFITKRKILFMPDLTVCWNWPENMILP